MHEPAVAEIPSHRRSLTGTFLVAVAGLLGVVALFETGTAHAVAGYAAPLAVRPTAALRARPRMQVPWADDAAGKAAWFAKLEDPHMAGQMSEEEAKAAWFAARDDLYASWGPSAAELADREGTRDPAPEVPAYVGPETPSMSEEQAKAAWLARQEAPAWGSGPASTQGPEEEAKAAWWAASAPEVPAELPMAQLPAEPPAARRSEEEAKAMWFAKQDAPVWGKPTEEQAKQKWLATSEANAAVLDQIRERNTRDPAPDVPVWEEPEIVAEADDTRDPAPAVSGRPAMPIELQARQRWRADRDSRDTPNTHWAQNAAIKPQPTTAQHSAKAATSYPFFKRSPGDGGVHLSEEKYLLQDCEAGDQDACETLAKEDEAKKAWLGKHETRYVNPDVLSWGNEHAQQQWYNQRDPSGRPYESRWR